MKGKHKLAYSNNLFGAQYLLFQFELTYDIIPKSHFSKTLYNSAKFNRPANKITSLEIKPCASFLSLAKYGPSPTKINTHFSCSCSNILIYFSRPRPSTMAP